MSKDKNVVKEMTERLNAEAERAKEMARNNPFLGLPYRENEDQSNVEKRED